MVRRRASYSVVFTVRNNGWNTLDTTNVSPLDLSYVVCQCSLRSCARSFSVQSDPSQRVVMTWVIADSQGTATCASNIPPGAPAFSASTILPFFSDSVFCARFLLCAGGMCVFAGTVVGPSAAGAWTLLMADGSARNRASAAHCPLPSQVRVCLRTSFAAGQSALAVIRSRIATCFCVNVLCLCF